MKNSCHIRAGHRPAVNVEDQPPRGAVGARVGHRNVVHDPAAARERPGDHGIDAALARRWAFFERWVDQQIAREFDLGRQRIAELTRTRCGHKIERRRQPRHTIFMCEGSVVHVKRMF